MPRSSRKFPSKTQERESERELCASVKLAVAALDRCDVLSAEEHLDRGRVITYTHKYPFAVCPCAMDTAAAVAAPVEGYGTFAIWSL